MPKGKKICPKCNSEHGVRTKLCECGHSFDTTIVAASNQSMVLEPLDKRIAESVGSVKSLLSKIGQRPSTQDSFEDDEILEEVLEEADTRRTMFQFGGGGQVAAPAGPCPFTPKGYKKGWPDGPASDEVIQNWANDVYNSGGGKYAVRAVVYWSRHFWDITGPERKRVKSLIIETLQPLRNSKSVNQAVLADK